MKKIALVTFLILLIDQVSKMYVKTHFELNESIPVIQGFFNKTFVENPGMAYGFHFGGIIGKYFLVIVRICLIGGMVYLFKKWLQKGESNYLLIPMAMIFAGAIGNLIDGMFYGMIFDSGTVFDESTGRWIGGKHLEFFKYIFNVADSAITVGAALLLIFRKKAFPNGLEF